jgi:nitrate reductase NapAB chaperone NapD
MSIAGMVIEIRRGSRREVLAGLESIPNVSVVGLTASHIMTVVEGDTRGVVETVAESVRGITGVTGVYPVYAGDG